MACDLGASAQPVKSFVLYNYPRSIENEARLHCSPSIRCATRHMATLAWLFLFLCGFQQQPGMCGFVFRFQLKSLGEEHKWRSKTKAEREGNHCSMSPCMSKPRNRWTTKSVAASGITSGPSNRSTWGSKVPWFFTSTRYTSWIENQSVSIISNRAVIKPDEVMAVWTHQSVFCQVCFSFEGLATTKPKRQLDMESIDDGLNCRFHPGMCGGSVASAQMAILDEDKNDDHLVATLW